MARGWVDTHTHLQDARIVDAAAMWAAARAAGVSRTLLAGVDRDDWKRQETLAHLPGVSFSAGLHPQRVAELSEAQAADELDALRTWLSFHTRQNGWLALGEIGLDGYGDRRSTFGLQSEAFAQQLDLAKKLERPVILHVLRAHEEALAILRKVGLPKAGGVVHSYSGSKELVPKYIELGLYLSFGGSITWAARNRAADALMACPLDRVLLETDAPDQTPLSRRPAPNEPAFLLDVARVAAEVMGISEGALCERTSENAERLFGFEQHVLEGRAP